MNYSDTGGTNQKLTLHRDEYGKHANTKITWVHRQIKQRNESGLKVKVASSFKTCRSQLI